MSTSLVCPRCGYANPENASFCADCAGVLKSAYQADFPPGQYLRSSDIQDQGGPIVCFSCKIPMERTRDVPFRISGYAGARRLVIGEVGELAERLLSVDFYICPKCMSIQLYANQKTKNALPQPLPRESITSSQES
jgi:Double zinc ribbon